MEDIKKQLAKVVEKLYSVKVEPNVVPAPAETGADYATNLAMQLAKTVHKPPMVIAELIKAELLETTNYQIELAAPGFINFTVAEASVSAEVEKFAEDLEQAVASGLYKDKTVIAEFSDPNPFKVLHVGHLYTSIVGDAISRLLEFAGAKVVRVNFGGDVGLHVAKTLYALLAMNKIADDGQISATNSALQNSAACVAQKNKRSKHLEDLTIENIAKCYVEGTQAYEDDVAAKAEITRLNKELYRINAEDLHDTELAELYWRGRELSYQYFEKFYDQIGVKFDKYYPESSVVDRGLSEVRAHIGTTYEESGGAIVYKGEKVGLHTRVFINREGVPTYETKDVGLIFTKWDDWHFDESIVVTGNEQSDYMKVVLASVSEYAPKLVERTTHLTHGLVKLPGNVKMSSRKGNFLKAVDTLAMVRDLLKQRARELSEDGDEEVDLDERLVLAAIKYAFLKYKMGGDIVFDPQESISMIGNSGIYIIYAAVRARKILQKQGGGNAQASELSARQIEGASCDEGAESLKDEAGYESLAQDVVRDKGELSEQEQQAVKALSMKILQYREILQEAVLEKAPYKVCNYLYELAQEFSRFYERVKVVGNAKEADLMKVVQAYLKVMLHGLQLLGIEVPTEM